MKHQLLFAAALCALVFQTAWAGHATVSHAWVRATMPGQVVAGAFLDIRSDVPAKLVAARSPITPQVEIHQMKMDGNIMRMRKVPGVVLPKNSVVSLKPGGYHIMLMQLKKPIHAGDKVPLTLIVETAGKREMIAVDAIARSPMDSAGASGMNMAH